MTVGAPKAVADDSTAAITGLVIDESTLPVAGATVGVIEHQLETKSDENGRFTLNGIPPGKARLAAHRLGYEDVVRAVEVTAGEVVTVNMQLTSIPLPDVSRSELKPRTGRIVCGTGSPAAREVVCGAALDPTETNQKFLFFYKIDKNATGQLWEQSWRPTQVLSRDLSLIIENTQRTITLADRHGCCYIRIALNDTKMDKDSLKAGSQGGDVESRTFPAGGTTSQPVNVFTDQAFTIYWEQFWGELPPDFATTRTNVPE